MGRLNEYIERLKGEPTFYEIYDLAKQRLAEHYQQSHEKASDELIPIIIKDLEKETKELTSEDREKLIERMKNFNTKLGA